MVPGHPCYSALGAFHPTPIASSRTSAQPTDRLPPARKTEHGVKERDVETGDDEAAHEHSPPPPARGAITSTRTPAATGRARGTPGLPRGQMFEEWSGLRVNQKKTSAMIISRADRQGQGILVFESSQVHAALAHED